MQCNEFHYVAALKNVCYPGGKTYQQGEILVVVDNRTGSGNSLRAAVAVKNINMTKSRRSLASDSFRTENNQVIKHCYKYNTTTIGMIYYIIYMYHLFIEAYIRSDRVTLAC